MTTELEKVIQIFGSQTKMAKELGLSDNAISKWVAKGHPPPNRVLEIMKHVEGKKTPNGEEVTLSALLIEASGSLISSQSKNKNT
ncbi:MAG: helix-turn-helix domain-containing protein [Agarilytica sp.]